MLLASPVRDQTKAVPITFTGIPADDVTLFISRNTGNQYDPSVRGVLVAAAPFFEIIPMGVVPASGVLETTLAVPDSWTPPYTATLFFAQALFTDSMGEQTLSNPTSLVVLDHVY